MNMNNIEIYRCILYLRSASSAFLFASSNSFMGLPNDMLPSSAISISSSESPPWPTLPTAIAFCVWLLFPAHNFRTQSGTCYIFKIEKKKLDENAKVEQNVRSYLYNKRNNKIVNSLVISLDIDGLCLVIPLEIMIIKIITIKNNYNSSYSEI